MLTCVHYRRLPSERSCFPVTSTNLLYFPRNQWPSSVLPCPSGGLSPAPHSDRIWPRLWPRGGSSRREELPSATVPEARLQPRQLLPVASGGPSRTSFLTGGRPGGARAAGTPGVPARTVAPARLTPVGRVPRRAGGTAASRPARGRPGGPVRPRTGHARGLGAPALRGRAPSSPGPPPAGPPPAGPHPSRPRAPRVPPPSRPPPSRAPPSPPHSRECSSSRAALAARSRPVGSKLLHLSLGACRSPAPRSPPPSAPG